MLRKIEYTLDILFVSMINTVLGLVGEHFGYPVLDKLGIVFASILMSGVQVIFVSILTPLFLAALLGDPLIAWRVPAYLFYALFLYLAFGLLRGEIAAKSYARLYIAMVFIGSGMFLIVSGSFLLILAGISISAFGLIIAGSGIIGSKFEFELDPRLIGWISIILAPFVIVAMNLTVYSFLFVNLFTSSWFNVIKGTLSLLMIDSAGPLILLGIIWWSFDLGTVVKETRGKINHKKRVVGMFVLLLLLSPLMLYGGYEFLSTENRVAANIEKIIPSDKWILSTMRLAFIWSPVGMSGVAFLAQPIEHINSTDPLFQSGINFYLINGRKFFNERDMSVDYLLLSKLITLQEAAWLRLEGAPSFEPVVSVVERVGKFKANYSYLLVNLTIKTLTDVKPYSVVILKAMCLLAYSIELGRITMILIYSKEDTFDSFFGSIINYIKEFSWV